ncbi:MAG: restriction endonuclease subunit S [Syntrophales bacterium]
MDGNLHTAVLRDLLTTTKDGDWGKGVPAEGFMPYCVIRGTDFPNARAGMTSSIPIRYLDKSSVHRRTLIPNDVLLETAGGSPDRPTGRSLLVTKRLLSSLDHPATCASFARFLRVDPNKAEPRYVYWYLQYLYETGQMEEHQVQHTGVARFQYTVFAETQQVPLPSMSEQQAIAHILGTLDDKIELNQRMNETLEAMARALFKSWFVNFDPVRAKAEGRNPGLPKHLADLFPHTFEDSEMGETPKGWLVKPLSELCDIGRGASPRPINDFMNGEVPWIKIADATAADGPFLFETKELLKSEGVDKSVQVTPGDLILSNSATCGVPIFVELYGCIHDGWLYFKNYKSISTIYLYHMLIELAAHLVHVADGSVQKNLNTGLVGSQKILVPPAIVIQAFDQQVQELLSKMRLNSLESRTLAALRDTLLPKLISGELRIKDAERFIN